MYETLVTREEMAQAEDMGGYYRIPCDARDLNYDKAYFEGPGVKEVESYHSSNTTLLDVEGMKNFYLNLDLYVKILVCNHVQKLKRFVVNN